MEWVMIIHLHIIMRVGSERRNETVVEELVIESSL